VEVERNWHGFYRGIAKNSVRIRFYLGNCGSTDQVAHFILVKTTYSGPHLAELYVSRIICLHRVPKKILSDRGTQFTSRFWERLHETLDTQLCFSSTYHPQTDGQTKRVNKILEDMLRDCAQKYGRSWDKSLSYAGFSYNNSYQESLKMAPSRCYMDVGAELRCFGMRLENERFLDPTYHKKSRSKFVWLGRAFELRSLDKRATPIIGEEN
jgi:transposase InsO family protein